MNNQTPPIIALAKFQQDTTPTAYEIMAFVDAIDSALVRFPKDEIIINFANSGFNRQVMETMLDTLMQIYGFGIIDRLSFPGLSDAHKIIIKTVIQSKTASIFPDRPPRTLQ